MPPALAAQTAARGALAAPVRWRRCAPHAPCWPALRSSAFPQPVPCSPPCTQPPSAAAAAGEGGPATDATSSTHGDVPPSAAAAAVPPPSRLQQEVALLVAIDVEYTHLALQPGGRQVSLPAEVCALDAEGRVLLYEHCNPTEELQGQRWKHAGGAHPALWRYAPPLADVRGRLAALLTGRVVVGHHLAKDLAALGLQHPLQDQRDTLRYPQLQGRGGAGRRLKALSAEKLGRDIQRGRRHSPREDAQAAMDLYLQHVHFDRQYMQYDDLVQHHLSLILGGTSTGSVELAADGGSKAEGGGVQQGQAGP